VDGELTTTFGVGATEGVYTLKLYVASGADLGASVTMGAITETVIVSISTTNQINF
jgi:hypothetical protein